MMEGAGVGSIIKGFLSTDLGCPWGKMFSTNLTLVCESTVLANGPLLAGPGTSRSTVVLVSLTQSLMIPLFPGLSWVQDEEPWGSAGHLVVTVSC